MAVAGSGIEAVHVWAYRRDIGGVPPQFLGAADLDGDRISLVHPSLKVGTYELAIFPRLWGTGDWAPAHTVTVVVR
jgi:hypothetical protein